MHPGAWTYLIPCNRPMFSCLSTCFDSTMPTVSFSIFGILITPTPRGHWPRQKAINMTTRIELLHETEELLVQGLEKLTLLTTEYNFVIWVQVWIWQAKRKPNQTPPQNRQNWNQVFFSKRTNNEHKFHETWNKETNVPVIPPWQLYKGNRTTWQKWSC